MRVTKTVKEYIEKEVTKKIYSKYEKEREAAEAERKIVNDFWKELHEYLERIARQKLNDFLQENNFVKETNRYHTRNEPIVACTTYRTEIEGERDIESVHRWKSRADAEVSEKVDEIIVALELGGDRQVLGKMLSEI